MLGGMDLFYFWKKVFFVTPYFTYILCTLPGWQFAKFWVLLSHQQLLWRYLFILNTMKWGTKQWTFISYLERWPRYAYSEKGYPVQSVLERIMKLAQPKHSCEIKHKYEMFVRSAGLSENIWSVYFPARQLQGDGCISRQVHTPHEERKARSGGRAWNVEVVRGPWVCHPARAYGNEGYSSPLLSVLASEM